MELTDCNDDNKIRIDILNDVVQSTQTIIDVNIVRNSVVEVAVIDTKNVIIIWHEECSLHCIDNHPEQPDRIVFILKVLRQNYPDDCFYEAPMVTDDEILLFHSVGHLKMFQTLCTKSERVGNEDRVFPIDGDTQVMSKTRKAAYRAAGSMILAVDSVFRKVDEKTPPLTRYFLIYCSY